MDKADFDDRWNKAFTFEKFKELLYKNPLPNGITRQEKFNDYCQKSYQKHREDKRRKKNILSKKRLLKAMRQRVQDQKILFENDEPTRAYNELKNFTPEERRAFDEWERQNKEHIVY